MEIVMMNKETFDCHHLFDVTKIELTNGSYRITSEGEVTVFDAQKYLLFNLWIRKEN